MSVKVTRTEVWVAEIDDQPGGLAQCLDTLAGAGANLECVIGRRQPNKPGKGLIFVTPLQGRKMTAAAARAGFRATRRVATLRLEGADKAGVGAKVARAIGAAGINLRGVSGATLGRRFVCYLGFDRRADATKAAAAIRRARL